MAIGRVTWVGKDGHPREAVMEDNGSWSCPDPDTADYLNTLYHGDMDDSPSNGPYGTMHVQLAARDVGGKFFLEGFEKSDPDTIY